MCESSELSARTFLVRGLGDDGGGGDANLRSSGFGEESNGGGSDGARTGAGADGKGGRLSLSLSLSLSFLYHSSLASFVRHASHVKVFKRRFHLYSNGCTDGCNDGCINGRTNGGVLVFFSGCGLRAGKINRNRERDEK